MNIFSGTCGFVAKFVHIISPSFRENYFLLMTGPLDIYNIA